MRFCLARIVGAEFQLDIMTTPIRSALHRPIEPVNAGLKPRKGLHYQTTGQVPQFACIHFSPGLLTSCF
jgi:hypothetical protein